MLPSRPGESLKVGPPRASPPRFDVAGMLPSRPGVSLRVAEPRVSPPRFDVAGMLPSRPGVAPFTASPGGTPAGGPRKSGLAGLKSGNFGTPCPCFCAAASRLSDSAAIATVEKYQLLLALMALSLLRSARQRRGRQH